MPSQQTKLIWWRKFQGGIQCSGFSRVLPTALNRSETSNVQSRSAKNERCGSEKGVGVVKAPHRRRETKLSEFVQLIIKTAYGGKQSSDTRNRAVEPQNPCPDASVHLIFLKVQKILL